MELASRHVTVLAALVSALVLAGCTGTGGQAAVKSLGAEPISQPGGTSGKQDRLQQPQEAAAPFAALALLGNKWTGSPLPGNADMSDDQESELPRGGGYAKIGKPYTIGGTRYVPQDEPGYSEEGMASWYGPGFHGRQTANGETFDETHLSAAHPTLPLPSYARVTNLRNGNSLIVRINDRGPFAKDRLIDLSKRAAEMLAFRKRGHAPVRLEYIGRAPLEGADDSYLLASFRDGEKSHPTELVALTAGQDLPGVGSDPSSRLRGTGELPDHGTLSSGQVSFETRFARDAKPIDFAAIEPRHTAAIRALRRQVSR